MDNVVINKVYGFLKENYKDDEDFEFTNEFLESNFVQEDIAILFEIHAEDSAAALIKIFWEFALYGYKRFIYTFSKNTNKLNANKELAQTLYFSYLSVVLGARSCKCLQGTLESQMSHVGFLLGINIIYNDWQESREMGDYLIDSLNAKNCIIGRGDAKALKSWFVLELYSILSKNEFNKRRALYPKDFSVYGAVLQEWNTEDFALLDSYVTILCNKHLELALTPMNVHDEDERKQELELPAFQIFPYEILAWLKLREQAGLKNPTEYTHPLMNTPIAKFFLDLKEPLAKPTELPYAKELLEKLKEKCPDVEIPEWLDGEKKKEKEPIPIITLKSNHIAPKTGRYQATLPQGHEIEDMLRNSGFDTKRLKEGETIGTFGLSGSDEDEIVWRYLGE